MLVARDGRERGVSAIPIGYEQVMEQPFSCCNEAHSVYHLCQSEGWVLSVQLLYAEQGGG